jgi:hypothetical protein
MKRNQFKNGGMAVICALVVLIFACKRAELNNILGQAGNEVELKKAATPSQLLGSKQTTFLIGSYSSVKSNFRDSADRAFEILSEVISSQEFQDSIATYSFPCSNGWYPENVCSNPGNIIINKCDPVSGNVLGTTVYDDFLMEDTVTLNVNIETNTAPNPTSLGYSFRCNYTINTYSYWLTDDRTLPVTQEYAIHLAHEYAHVLGYFHSASHSTSQDVAYRIGAIVRNILWKWHLAAVQTTTLHTIIQTDSKYRFLSVNPPSMPQTSAFNTILQADIANATGASRTYNHFYLDFNPPVGQRTGGSNVVFGVTTASGSYWIEYNYYQMQWVNAATGIVSFTYKGNNGSTSTTASFSQNIRNLLDNYTFQIDYSSHVLNVGKVTGKLTCVEDPTIVFYGQLEKTWSNW